MLAPMCLRRLAHGLPQFGDGWLSRHIAEMVEKAVGCGVVATLPLNDGEKVHQANCPSMVTTTRRRASSRS
jgi:hypothetical protein